MARKGKSSEPSLPVEAHREMDEGRRVVLDKALGDIVKRYGDGAIMRMGEAHQLEVEAIPTGSLSLDLALGVGGLPRGRVTEIYGPESSGKTTICLHVVAEAQRMGGTAAYVDMEHALDPTYAAKLGVNVNELYVSPAGYRRAGRSKLPIPLSAPVRWTLLSSIRWLLWYPGRKLKAIWVIHPWVCKPV